MAIDFKKFLPVNAAKGGIDFNKFLPKITKTAISPSPTTKISTLPAFLGGGAFNVVAGKPNEILNTGHTIYGGEPEKSGQQRDDIIPVGLGGSNISAKNIRYELSDKTGTATDPIEIKAINDFKTGKISLPEARLRVLTAKQKQTGILPPQGIWGNLWGGIKEAASDVFPATATEVGGIVKTVKKDLQKTKDIITKPTSPESVKAISTVGKIAGNILNFPHSKDLPQLAINVVEDTIGQIYDADKEEIKRVSDLFNKPMTTSEAVAQGIRATTGAVNVLFAPISAIFNEANNIPVLGSLSKIIMLPFAAGGDVGQKLFSQALNALPINKEVKDNMKDAVDEIGTLAGQLVLGGKAMEMGEGFLKTKTAELTKKFGTEDANAIMEAAKSKADATIKSTIPKIDFQKFIPKKIPKEESVYFGTKDISDVSKVEIPKIAPRELDVQKIIADKNFNDYSSFWRKTKADATTRAKELSKDAANTQIYFPFKEGNKYGVGIVDTRSLQNIERYQAKLPTFTKDVPVIKPSLLAEAKKYKTAEEFVKAQIDSNKAGRFIKEKDFVVKDPNNPKFSGKFSDYSLGGSQRKGKLTVEKSKNGWRIRNVFVDNGVFGENLRRKGITTEAYRNLNEQSLLDTGKPLRSSDVGYARKNSVTTLSDSGESVWKKLVANGDAEKVGDYYQFKPKSQLTDIWNEAQKTKPVEQPKPVEPSKLQSRVYERLKSEIPEGMRDDVRYNEINLKKDAENAAELIARDKNEAYQVAMGIKEAPEGQTATTVNIVLAEKALEDGNFTLYSQLVKNRSLEQTRRGQEIAAEKGSITDNGTSRYVKELISERLDKLGKKYFDALGKTKIKSRKERAIKTIDKEVIKVKEKLSSKELDIKEAQSILDKLTCR